VVEDYRKLSGIYTDQLIAKTKADSLGFFEFSGNILENQNRIYRIHMDKCSEDEQDFNHFNGYCEDSLEVLFIANNQDSLYLPLTGDSEMFCRIESGNPSSDAFLKIEGLKNEMRFDYSEVNSEASKRLNNKNWFKRLQDFGVSLNEPIAELAIYDYLSDRSNEFYDYYLEDLIASSYYDELKTRLIEKYPNSPYTSQYKSELEADLYAIDPKQNSGPELNTLLIILLFLSLATNAYLIYKNKQTERTTSANLKSALSKQEQVVLEHILNNKTNKEIAEILFLSISTVKSHTNNIYKKLNVRSRDEAKSLFGR
jgi:DNA-binding CsgD family transcriptional regulator